MGKGVSCGSAVDLVSKMSASTFFAFVIVAAVVYVLGLGRVTSRAEKEAQLYLSQLELTFLESEDLLPLCKTKWEEAKTTEEDFIYDPEREEDPWSDPP